MTRDEILGDFDALRDEPGFLAFRNVYLEQAVQQGDLPLAKAMLELGADPNASEVADEGYLHDLYWQYRQRPSTSEHIVLSIATLLLEAGADPNRIGCNNYRAYDLALQSGASELASILLLAGAHPAERPFV
ncbi:MAG: hypothetical protein IPO08_10125 [Xanthomonadales bacterium]|nr:hypothetical protein [Xanthomonadales bacterium]